LNADAVGRVYSTGSVGRVDEFSNCSAEWLEDGNMPESIAKSFENNLDSIYGKFSSRELSQSSLYGIHCNDGHFLKPIVVHSKALCTARIENGLNSKWHDHFFIMQQISGHLRVSSDGHSGLLRPNDLVLLDSYSAYEYLTARSSKTVLSAFHLDFVDAPSKLLASCGQRIDGSNGIGQILGTTLSTLCSGDGPSDTADKNAILDAIKILLSRVIDRGEDDLPLNDGAGLLQRAETYVLRELSDPSLSPASIAAAVGVSRRQLYRLFSDINQTPNSWIWQLRIGEAHARICAPGWSSQSLTQIAFDTGFNDMAHFSRVYRAKYGRTPRESRPDFHRL
jgi:AraC family transcriptional regulator, positive regulator of tynA and feaB